MLSKFLYVVGLLTLVGFNTIFAQYTLQGTVQDATNAQVLKGATVSLHELNRETITDSTGKFSFAGLRSASYHLHISYVGYSSATEIVPINRSNKAVDFFLLPTSIELNEVVVESNHFKTGAKEHSLAVEILDTDYLKKNRKNTFANSLEDLPGINTINTGVGIAKPVIRGLSSNRIIVNDLGIKQEGQQWGNDHGLEIDMFNPGRVEIIKGPGSLMYGSDGIGGVINIFAPNVPSENSFDASLQTLYKSNNNSLGLSAMAEGAKNNRFFRIRVSSQDFGDYKVPAESFNYNSYQLPIYGNRLKNTAGNERNFSLMGGVRKSWGYSTVTVSNFNQKAGLFVGAVGVPRSYQLKPDGDNRNIDLPNQEINHFKLISNTNILLGKNWAEIDFGYQHNNRVENSNPEAHGKAITQWGTKAHQLKLQTLSLNARYYQHPTDHKSRTSGFQAEWQQNRRGGFEFLLPNFNRFSLGAFVLEEATWGNSWTSTIGLRADYGSVDITKQIERIQKIGDQSAREYVRNDAINRNFFNISGGIGASYYPSSDLNVKVNLGSSFRMPTATELSMNGVHHGTFRHELGDSDLKSERGFQADFNFSVQKKYISVIVSPFIAYYSNYIYLAPTSMFSSALDPDAFPEGGQIFQYRQDNALYGGGEVAVDFHPIKPLHIKTAFESVFNHNFRTKIPLPFTPPISFLGEVNYELPFENKVFTKTHIGLSLKVVGAQNRVDRNEKTTKGYELVGVNIGSSLKIGKVKPELILTASNLFNVFYINHLSRYKLLNLPEQGRNFAINLHVPFATL